MVGLIALKKSSDEPKQSSTEPSVSNLREWLTIFQETFQHNSPLSALQIRSYQITLRHLSPAEIHAACVQTLATWTFATMPPPAVILEVHNALQGKARSETEHVESSHWLDNQPSDEELHRRGVEYCQRAKEYTLTIVDMEKTAVKPEPKPIIATNERLALLEKQKKEVLIRFATKI